MIRVHFLVLFLFCAALLAVPSQSSAQTQLSLVSHPIARDIPVDIKGINQGGRTPIENVVSNEFEQKFRPLGAGTNRFPAGTQANNYDWKSELNDNTRLNLKHALAFAVEFDHKINYVLNYGNTTPAEAAELVHILNNPAPQWQALRELYFDVSDPVGVDVWEIGNELAGAWEWHVSWVAGGHGQELKFRSDQPVVPLPRLLTDSLHYFGGDFWREGWVDKKSDGMTIINSVLGELHRVTPGQQAEGQVFVKVEFGPIIQDSVRVWAVDAPIDFSALADVCAVSENTCQQLLYDNITQNQYRLTPADYTISGDSGVLLSSAFTLDTNNVVLVEYKTHHAGAFDMRDAMKAADPSIKVGYCIDFRATQLGGVAFDQRLAESPPDFLIEHPYNGDIQEHLVHGYISEIMHKVDEKISNEFIPKEQNLDSICESLGLPQIGLALTEWNIRLCGDGACDPAYNGILGGLYTANFFSQFYQVEADEELDLIALNHFAGIATGNNLIHMFHYNGLNPEGDRVEVTPQAEAFRMVNDVLGDQMFQSSALEFEDLAMQTLAKPVLDSLGGYTFDPTDSSLVVTLYDVPALKIFASEEYDADNIANDTLKVLVLNNDDQFAHDVVFNWPCDKTGGVGALEVLSGTMVDATYTVGAGVVVNVGDQYSFTAPPLSVVTLKIPYTEPQAVCICTADYDVDGVVGVSDLLLILGDLGCQGACQTDLDSNHNVVVSDILLFLAMYGSLCL